MRAIKSKTYSGYNRKKEFSPEEKAAFKAQSKKNLEAFHQNAAARTLSLLTGKKELAFMPALSLPRNPATNSVFQGANSWILSQYMIENNLSDPRFLKGYQAKRLNPKAHIRKGEEGIHILEPVKYEIKQGQVNEELVGEGISAEEQDAIFGDVRDGHVTYFRPHSVFHASQFKHMPAHRGQAKVLDMPKGQLAESLVQACGIKLVFGADRPAYALSTDTIHMPGKRNFQSQEDYAAALLKQWYMATASPAREGRFKGPSSIGEGLLNQAAEALRAETFGLVAAQTLGLPFKLSTQPVYIKCWDKQLNENPRHITDQTAHATNMVNTVVAFAQGNQPKLAWFPDKSTWPTASAGDLDHALNQDDTLVSQIQQIVADKSLGFVETQGQGGQLVYSCNDNRNNETGQVGEQDVMAAFEIREALLNEFRDLEIDVEDQDGTIVLRIDPESLEPDDGPAPGH